MTQRLTQVASALVNTGKIVLAAVEIFIQPVLSETSSPSSSSSNINNEWMDGRAPIVATWADRFSGCFWR